VVTGAVVRQFLLLPALMLRRELHQQQQRSSFDAQAVYSASQASAATLPLLQCWRDLHELVDGSRSASAGAWAGLTAEADSAIRAASNGLMAPILHEILQLPTQLLLGVMQASHPGGKNSSSTTTSTGGTSNTDSQASSSTSKMPPEWGPDVRPAVAAAAVLSCVIAVLLPLATQAVMDPEATTPTRDTTPGRGRGRSSKGKSSIGWPKLFTWRASCVWVQAI
jgi:hypothetical protein